MGISFKYYAESRLNCRYIVTFSKPNDDGVRYEATGSIVCLTFECCVRTNSNGARLTDGKRPCSERNESHSHHYEKENVDADSWNDSKLEHWIQLKQYYCYIHMLCFIYLLAGPTPGTCCCFHIRMLVLCTHMYEHICTFTHVRAHMQTLPAV